MIKKIVQKFSSGILGYVLICTILGGLLTGCAIKETKDTTQPKFNNEIYIQIDGYDEWYHVAKLNPCYIITNPKIIDNTFHYTILQPMLEDENKIRFVACECVSHECSEQFLKTTLTLEDVQNNLKDFYRIQNMSDYVVFINNNYSFPEEYKTVNESVMENIKNIGETMDEVESSY